MPHKETHQKAHLISWEGLVIYLLLFILLQVGFSIVGFYKPGILGTSSNITQQKIIELTNQERAKANLEPVAENQALDQAAKAKAANMFAENYWAHFAPSGRTPWDFILGTGYKFSYAGENLAKNFYNSDDVVKAWVNSPSHRENLLNLKYKDIGIAVEDGVLNGQKTTLVVQMFGTQQAQIAAALPSSVDLGGKSVTVSQQEINQKPQLVAAAQTSVVVSMSKPFLDPYQISRSAGLSVIFFVVALLALDFIILKKRGVFRLSSHHLAHMIFLSASAALILSSAPGSIL